MDNSTCGHGRSCLRDSRLVEREVHSFWAEYARCYMPWDVYGHLELSMHGAPDSFVLLSLV